MHNTIKLPQHIWLILLCCANFAVLWQLCCVYYRATVRYSIQCVVACFLCIALITLPVRSKQDISPSEGQNCPLQRALRNEGFQRVQLIDTSCPHNPSQLSKMMVPPCGHGMMMQKGTSRNSCLVPLPTPFNPTKLSLWRVTPLKG